MYRSQDRLQFVQKLTQELTQRYQDIRCKTAVSTLCYIKTKIHDAVRMPKKVIKSGRLDNTPLRTYKKERRN